MAAATTLSSTRLRNGSRRTTALATIPVASAARSGGATASAVARASCGAGRPAAVSSSGEHARLRECERRQPGRRVGGEGQSAGRERAVDGPAPFHGVAEHRERAGKGGTVAAEGGRERVRDVGDGEALPGSHSTTSVART